MHGHFNLPLFGIIEKTRIKIKGKEGVCNHHLLGNGEKPTCDTLKYWYGNEIGHPQSRTEKYRSIVKHGKAIKQNQIRKQDTITSQIFTSTAEEQCS